MFGLTCPLFLVGRLVAKTQQSIVARRAESGVHPAGSRTGQPDAGHVADQLRQKLAAFIDDSETDVLSHLDFPEQHRTKLHSTNPLERLNKEVKRRADVVGIFPNEPSIVRLIGAVLLEQNDEWQLQHRYMQVEAMAELLARRAKLRPSRSPHDGTLRPQVLSSRIRERQTAASTASMPHARPWRRGQAPKPHRGAPKAQGCVLGMPSSLGVKVPCAT